MHTLRAIKCFLAIGSFVLLLTACSVLHVSTAGSDQTVHVPLGTTLLNPQSASNVFTVAWSTDDKRLALGYADGSVQAGQHFFTYHGHADIVGALAWSPDGKRIASVDNQLQVWQAS